MPKLLQVVFRSFPSYSLGARVWSGFAVLAVFAAASISSDVPTQGVATKSLLPLTSWDLA